MEWIIGIAGVLFVIFLFNSNKKKNVQNNKILDDSEFDNINFHFKNFREVQELAVKFSKNKIHFRDERSKMKYFHFMMGAIDYLSRLIQNEHRAEIWFITAPIMMQNGEAFVLDSNLIKSYGQSDEELYKAGQLGWEAMDSYLKLVAGKITQDEFVKPSLSLSKLLRPR